MHKDWCAEWLKDIGAPYYEEDADPRARGIRCKPQRYRDTVGHWIRQTVGAFEWEGLPEEVPPWVLELWLQVYGWAAMIKTEDGVHIVSAPVAWWNGQYTPYYQPAGVIVTNPYAVKWSGEYQYNDNAVLCRGDPLMQGMLPIIGTRAEMQVETDVSIICALQNLRIINLVKASTDKVKLAAENLFRRIRWGRQGIIQSETQKNLWSGATPAPDIEMLPLSGVPPSYMQQLIETCQYIRGSLYNELGLQANWNAKRETLNDSEINAGEDTLRPLIDSMLKCREIFCEDCRRVLGLDISVKLAGAWAARAELAELEVEQAETAADPEPEPAEPQAEEVPEDAAE